MNVANNMEFIFFGVVTLSCGWLFVTTTPPVIVVNVTSSSARPRPAQPMIARTDKPKALPRVTVPVNTPVTRVTPTPMATTGALTLSQR